MKFNEHAGSQTAETQYSICTLHGTFFQNHILCPGIFTVAKISIIQKCLKLTRCLISVSCPVKECHSAFCFIFFFIKKDF